MGRAAIGHLEEGDAKGPDVGLGAVSDRRLASTICVLVHSSYFRSHPASCADIAVGALQFAFLGALLLGCRGLQGLGDAKVHEKAMASLVDEDVGRFDVTVDDRLRQTVAVGQGLQGLFHDGCDQFLVVETARPGQGLSVVQNLTDRTEAHVGHNNPQLVVGGEGRVQVQDVRVLDVAHELHFVEHFHQVTASSVQVEHLDCNSLVTHLRARALVHCTKPTFANFFLEFVVLRVLGKDVEALLFGSAILNGTFHVDKVLIVVAL
mmetsp:Transcript_1908/g.2524  ORF Transcript_1908/g.2524 Transcript_1908/m.2524 type:complete len:264 (+) Transcript_1908:656-1447(+)